MRLPLPLPLTGGWPLIQDLYAWTRQWPQNMRGCSHHTTLHTSPHPNSKCTGTYTVAKSFLKFLLTEKKVSVNIPSYCTLAYTLTFEVSSNAMECSAYPLPHALVMDLHASETLRTGPYKSQVHK